ncbi:MAG: pancreas/duodenum homeobox protein 1 [Desulfobacterales bacterium]|nr:pancreas/duodenum homeobox protein 1 [Desulfobacterales bacterium]
MDQIDLDQMVTQEFLDTLLPAEKSDQFFEALYGDAEEGAYDIRLEPVSVSQDRIVLAFNLAQRPGKCLVCSLTYGLPNVFSRHPLINIKGMVDKMGEKGIQVKNWRLGDTEESSSSLHVIPLYLDLV